MKTHRWSRKTLSVVFCGWKELQSAACRRSTCCYRVQMELASANTQKRPGGKSSRALLL